MPRLRSAQPLRALAEAPPARGRSADIAPRRARVVTDRREEAPAAGVTRLSARCVDKVWGRRDIPEDFGCCGRPDPVGEVWFEHPEGVEAPLLVKYLFTSEKLSVQVHPNHEAAAKTGHSSGKDEAWLVLKADEDASIGLGLRETASEEALRQAAEDGGIEQLVDWRPAAAGDFHYSPAGTIHALGPGLMLIEIQQNVDVTYRLYDYGRPRQLHLDEAIKVADAKPYRSPVSRFQLEHGREVLVHGQTFVLERWTKSVRGTIYGSPAAPVWLVPVRGGGFVGEECIGPAGVWMVDGAAPLRFDEDSEILVAYCGRAVRPRLIR